MGTIQNSINQVLGTVAGAAALGKHVSEQKKANELNELSQSATITDEAKDLIKEAEKLTDADKQNLENIETTKQDLENSANWTGPFRDDKTGKYISKDKYQTMRELSLQKMEQQQKVIETQKYEWNLRKDLYNNKLNVLGLDRKGLTPDLNKLATKEQLNKIEYIKKGGKK